MILIAVVGAIAALIAVIIACKVRSGFATLMMVGLALVFISPAACVFLVFHPELIDGRFRTYKAFYRDIQIGMTHDDVFVALEKRYPKSGTRQRPQVMQDSAEGIGFFMNPETSREPNCEGIFLSLDHGRVTKKDYCPD